MIQSVRNEKGLFWKVPSVHSRYRHRHLAAPLQPLNIGPLSPPELAEWTALVVRGCGSTACCWLEGVVGGGG